jgi:hypothetical protein
MLEHPTAPGLSRAGSAHGVQLFDSDESLADTVADFLGEGLMLKQTVLAVLDEQRWYAIAMRLSTRGVPVDEALGSGHLIVRNAREMLTKFMRHDRPHRGLFNATVGTMVSELAALPRRVRIYGEMVDVLAAQGQYAAAHELEELWTELGREKEFTLFCGYSAGHFGDPRTATALLRICASHTEVLSSPRDVLGSFLLREHFQQTG